jgi:hypothetical protein
MTQTNIKMVVIVFLVFAFTATEAQEDLQILGRVYDTDQIKKCIDDADLMISVSGRPPDKLTYPKQNGKYDSLSFNRGRKKNVIIRAVHPKYAQTEKIEYVTDAFKETRNVRMKYKEALAEENYRDAQKIVFNPSISQSESLKAFQLTQDAINLSPKSRYYLFQADNIGRCIRLGKPAQQLPEQIVNFARLAPEEPSFSKLSEKEKYDFYLKLGHGFAKAEDLNSSADGHRSYLILSIEAYNEAIKIRSEFAEAYQGKYIVQAKAGNYFDAIKTISDFFDKNDPVKTEHTIKGFLGDWSDFVRVATGYNYKKGDMQRIRSTADYFEAWQTLSKRLDQYEKYFFSGKIAGNKKLHDAQRIAHKIIKGI